MAAFLVPTDMSDAALNATVVGAQLLGVDGNSFTFAHTYMDPGLADPLVMGTTPGLLEELGRSMNEWMGRFKQVIGREDLEVHADIGIGTLAGTVQAMTRGGRFAAVIMDAGVADSAWFSSPAVTAVKVSHAPVLVVPPGARPERIKRIVLADDGGDVKPAALKLVRDIAHAQGADVIILRVLPDDAIDLSADGSPLHHAMFAGVPHSFNVIRSDEVAAAIDEHAVSSDAGLVTVLHRHLDLFSDIFHRSMSRRLATLTHLPLLVLEQ